MSEIVHTSVSTRQRTIHLLLDDGNTDRYALIRRPNGDVHWCHDLFAGNEWISHQGRVPVAHVVARAPHCRRDILRWTSEEIEDGPESFDLDIFKRDVRRRALAVLSHELRAVQGEAAA